MIVKTKNGYQVRSSDGSKNLSKPDLSHAEAVKRLQAIEYFKKHHAGKGKK